ncbi:MAG: hypothetical protein KKH01_01145 [Firmicutes bacterium]|nr:hypothetical protein [Bacillota bacterium]
MKKVIIVTGHHAALKTTVSRQLGSDLGLLVYHLEEMKDIIMHHDAINEDVNHNYYRKLALKLIKKLIVDTLEVQDSVIVDIPYLDVFYSPLVTLCKDHGFESVTLFMTGDADVLFKRYSQRAPYDVMFKRSDVILDILDFKDTWIPISPTLKQEHTIEVDTTTFDEQDYRILMHQVIDKLEWKLNDSSL